ncbi:uncharacterized protein V6R79_005938 [Siganus canaliculatus]
MTPDVFLYLSTARLRCADVFIKSNICEIPSICHALRSLRHWAMVDTGAQTTVISVELYQSLSGNDSNTLHETYLLNAGVGDSMKARCGLKVTFKIASKVIDWEVHVAPIRDSVLLGYDLMKAHDVVVHTRGKVFIGDELVPSKVVTDGADYCVARATLGESTILTPTSECVVWGEVENPRPGVPAVLEPLTITGSVASGSVAVTMEKKLLLTYEALFAKSDSDLGYLSAITHKIDTGTAKPAYNSDVVPVWVQRLRSQVLKLSQDPAKQPLEEDSSVVPELPLREDTSTDLTEDCSSLQAPDRGEASQRGL